jgi:NAD(P)-dependent dehydrogenase (short-subunit alcohol dehydrogenase family)
MHGAAGAGKRSIFTAPAREVGSVPHIARPKRAVAPVVWKAICMNPWTTRDIPSQQGRVAVITGATGGLGLQTALALAGAGAEVVLTGRNPGRGEIALNDIRADFPRAAIRYETLDLGSLRSIADFASRFGAAHGSLDILVNNAGVMAPPTRQVTADGFELQFGTNYLGHFALTARLLPMLRQGQAARVVNLSSVAHRFGASIHFDDLNWRRRYMAFPAYGQSKLAMLMFTFELQRRSDANGWGLLSVAAHPGFATTSLLSNGPHIGRSAKASLVERVGAWFVPLVAQSPREGALPTLYAATSRDATKAGYYGPNGFMELKGRVGSATVGKRATDLAVATQLWNVSERLTGVQFAATTAARPAD